MSFIFATQHMNFFPVVSVYCILCQIACPNSLQIRQRHVIYILPINTHRRLDTTEERISEFKDRLVGPI